MLFLPLSCSFPLVFDRPLFDISFCSVRPIPTLEFTTKGFRCILFYLPRDPLLSETLLMLVFPSRIVLLAVQYICRVYVFDGTCSL